MFSLGSFRDIPGQWVYQRSKFEFVSFWWAGHFESFKNKFIQGHFSTRQFEGNFGLFWGISGHSRKFGSPEVNLSTIGLLEVI